MNISTFSDWIMSTGFSVALLVALIVFIRRPISRILGPHAAYMLWSLPFLRLVMPNMTWRILPPEPVTDAPVFIDGLVTMPAIIESQAPTYSSDMWIPALILVWVMVSGIWLLFQLVKQKTYRENIYIHSRPACENLLATTVCIADEIGLKHMPDIRMANDAIGPMVMGVINPVIILPHDFDINFEADQQDMALMHELAHIKRGDLWAGMAFLVLRALNWPNPLIHLAARQFRCDQEAACDASVIQHLGGTDTTLSSYAETLIIAAKSAAVPKQAMPLGLTIHHPLKERLMIMKTPKLRTSMLTRIAAIGLVLGLATATAPITLAGPDTPELAGKHDTEKSKQVIKWSEDVDGVETKKHYEIITENGVKKAYEIDYLGNRFEIDPATIKSHNNMGNIKINHAGGEEVDITILSDDGSEEIRRIQIVGDHMKHGQHGQHTFHKDMIIKHLKDKDAMEAYTNMMSDNMEIHISRAHAHKSHANKAKLKAAQSLLAGIEGDESLDSSTRRKLEKALKYLDEAQDALDKE